jgi:NAD+ synthase (glutamine-hydrolysing)
MGPAPALRLAVAQLAAVPRAVERNAEAIAAAAAAAGADLLLTPELSLTGYELGDAVHRLALPAEPGTRLHVPALDGAPGLLVVGLPEAAPGGPYNAAAALHAGSIVFRHRKLYVPTYGMFDEGRWFGRGARVDAWTEPSGWRIGILICEDFWHPALAYLLAAHGIELLLVAAAAAGRGVWEGGEHGAFASADVWERMARTAAQLYGIYIALANRVGVEGGVSFAGGSLVAGPDGTVLGRADDRAERTLVVELSRAELERARRPYAHARDEDHRLVARELARLLEAS